MITALLPEGPELEVAYTFHLRTLRCATPVSYHLIPVRGNGRLLYVRSGALLLGNDTWIVVTGRRGLRWTKVGRLRVMQRVVVSPFGLHFSVERIRQIKPMIVHGYSIHTYPSEKTILVRPFLIRSAQCSREGKCSLLLSQTYKQG